MDGRDARKGANEAWFREVNERLERRAAGHVVTFVRSGDAETFSAVCECDLEECAERLSISFADYERVRAGPRRFLIVPGHDDPKCELVVSSHDGFDVVEKFGIAGAVADGTDPRDEMSGGEAAS
jgi:hypothetical protein